MDPSDSALLSPITKSWVAARYTFVENNGICRRRCKFSNCGKEYSRGTSHMTLKKHWAKQHSEQFIHQTTSQGRNKTVSTHMPIHLTSDEPSRSNGDSKKTTKSMKKRLKDMSGLFKSTQKQKSKCSDKDILQDVKLISRRLKEASSLHISFNIQEAKKGAKLYAVITAYSYSEGGLKSVVLEYKHMSYPNDQQALYDCLKSCISKFNIREKIISIASGYSDAMHNAVIEVDKKLRISKNFNFSSCVIRCFSQFIHYNINEIYRSHETMIEYIRNIVGLINSSEYISIVQADRIHIDSNTLQVRNDIEPIVSKTVSLTLPQDNKSSWNTTFEMIENFLQHKELLQASIPYLLTHAQLNSDQLNYNIDWSQLYSLFVFLKPIYEMMRKFASDNYVPVSMVFTYTQSLINHLSQINYPTGMDNSMKNFKDHLEIYKNSYLSDLTTVASLLDPRIKDSFLTDNERHRAPELLQSRINMQSIAKPSMPHDSVFYNCFEHVDDEIHHYLSSRRCPEPTNILYYWESQKNSYPRLYNLAKSVLCVQISSVSGDRLFSAADVMIKERRVTSDSSESKEMFKSWAKYLEKD